MDQKAFLLSKYDCLLKNKTLMKDKELILRAIKYSPFVFEHADETLRNDKDMVLQAIEIDRTAIYYAGNKITEDKEFIMQILDKAGYALKYAPDYAKKDKKIVESAMRASDGVALVWADEELQNDKDLVMLALELGRPFKLAVKDQLQNDKDIIRKAVKYYNNPKNDKVFNIEPLANISDENFAYELFCLNSVILEQINENLRNDMKFMLRVAKRNTYSNYYALKYASDELRNNENFMSKLIENDPMIFTAFDEKLQKDQKFIKRLLELTKNTDFLSFISDEFKNDPNFILDTVDICPQALCRASDDLLSNKEFMMKAVKKRGSLYTYASDELKSDKDLLIEAMKIDPHMIKYANDDLKNKASIQAKAMLYSIKKKSANRDEFIKIELNENPIKK